MTLLLWFLLCLSVPANVFMWRRVVQAERKVEPENKSSTTPRWYVTIGKRATYGSYKTTVFVVTDGTTEKTYTGLDADQESRAIAFANRMNGRTYRYTPYPHVDDVKNRIAAARDATEAEARLLEEARAELDRELG